jgi:hypothetical protein
MKDRLEFDRVRLAGLAVSASGRHDVQRSNPTVRAFPFPFLGGLAVASGTESYTRTLFDDLQAFVAGRGPTAHGDGLGLEIGGAFSVAPAGDAAGRLSFGDSPASSFDESRVLDLIAAGWLDTLYGDEAAIRRGLEMAQARSLDSPAVIVVSPGRGPAGQSLSVQCSGVRYQSNDRFLERGKFGDHCDYRSDVNLHEAMENYLWGQWPADATTSVGPDGVHGLVSLFNRTILTTTSPPLLFKRYRGALYPTATTFPVQVTSALLDDLQAKGGAVVLESHFGQWSLIGRTGPLRPVGASALDHHAIACWNDIASRNRSGTLLVATLSRLLDYLWLRSHLNVSITRTAEKWIIALDSVGVPGGGDRDVTQTDLNGLSLVVPDSAPEVVVTTRLRQNPLPVQRVADPAGKRIDAVYLPWSRLEYPIG